jgi:hypothetical protein
MKIRTSHWLNPIPGRRFDWEAVDEDAYDADWQGEETGFVSHSPVGHGATEEAAIADLLDQLIDQAQQTVEAE